MNLKKLLFIMLLTSSFSIFAQSTANPCAGSSGEDCERWKKEQQAKNAEKNNALRSIQNRKDAINARKTQIIATARQLHQNGNPQTSEEYRIAVINNQQALTILSETNGMCRQIQNLEAEYSRVQNSYSSYQIDNKDLRRRNFEDCQNRIERLKSSIESMITSYNQGLEITQREENSTTAEIGYGTSGGQSSENNSNASNYNSSSNYNSQAVNAAADDLANAVVGIINSGMFDGNPAAQKRRWERRKRNRKSRQIRQELDKDRNDQIFSAEVVSKFNDDGIAVKRSDNGWFGYIDKKGNWIIEPKYLRAEPFIDGLAEVETKTGRTITIDIKGKKQ